MRSLLVSTLAACLGITAGAPIAIFVLDGAPPAPAEAAPGVPGFTRRGAGGMM